jgi:DNA-binding MarR family transcriptional regulator
MSTRTTKPQAANASDALLGNLERAMREAGAQSTLHGLAVADKLGISASDLDALDVIHLRAPLTAGDLATATGLTTGAITGMIDRLERAGLAVRRRDAPDRRKVMVALAPTAFARIAPLFEGRRLAMERLLSKCSPAQLRFLIEFFQHSLEIAVAETKALHQEARPTADAVALRRRPTPSRA